MCITVYVFGIFQVCMCCKLNACKCLLYFVCVAYCICVYFYYILHVCICVYVSVLHVACACTRAFVSTCVCVYLSININGVYCRFQHLRSYCDDQLMVGGASLWL